MTAHQIINDLRLSVELKNKRIKYLEATNKELAEALKTALSVLSTKTDHHAIKKANDALYRVYGS